MDLQSLTEHARQCRAWAKELIGKPDSEALLKIAHEFDAIAKKWRAGQEDEDQTVGDVQRFPRCPPLQQPSGQFDWRGQQRDTSS